MNRKLIDIHSNFAYNFVNVSTTNSIVYSFQWALQHHLYNYFSAEQVLARYFLRPLNWYRWAVAIEPDKWLEYQAMVKTCHFHLDRCRRERAYYLDADNVEGTLMSILSSWIKCSRHSFDFSRNISVNQMEIVFKWRKTKLFNNFKTNLCHGNFWNKFKFAIENDILISILRLVCLCLENCQTCLPSGFKFPKRDLTFDTYAQFLCQLLVRFIVCTKATYTICFVFNHTQSRITAFCMCRTSMVIVWEITYPTKTQRRLSEHFCIAYVNIQQKSKVSEFRIVSATHNTLANWKEWVRNIRYIYIHINLYMLHCNTAIVVSFFSSAKFRSFYYSSDNQCGNCCSCVEYHFVNSFGYTK